MNSKDSNTLSGNVLKAVDFFCGAGGVTCGFSKIGIKVLGGIDIDPKFKKTYEENNKTTFINEDVSELSLHPERLKELLPIQENDDNLIFVGCSPCQYYSNLKSDKTKSEAGRLLLDDFKEFVLLYKPGFVFIENVPGLGTKDGSPIDRFKKTLKKEGYTFDDGVRNAKYFDVPQNRRRYVLIASRVIDEIKLPEEQKEKSKIITVQEVIGDYNKFPPIQDGYKDSSKLQHSVAKLSDLNLKRVKKIPKNGGTRKAWENDKELQLECYKTHKGHYDVYGRLFWSKPSPTITTRFIYTSTGRYSHPEQDRGLSLREGATLQSFPLDYHFYSSNQGAIATMIGNAVPPKLAEKIGLSIKNQWDKWQHSKQKHVL
ncbi:DNA cytosine methyltransferase [Aquimarina sp. BL5]|uniref:DNA cytosine methyltransferase n=1 Tax=Aquimarina sp. BL5 TaxID=1714860 RepID=UPI000E553D31|nr:DNA cytosine methyltransferase [Aquimarina sp. BL5]AXT51359.1 DNA cytosine methyltransferase [Aquimarina sp. BL5]RKN09851.1 DNA (cytosine-5-)-methyltransferase [Aquimarina sp. BL5]